jgi:hypothetical protein
MEVNVGGHGCGLAACGGSTAASSDALGTASSGPGSINTMDLNDDKVDDDDYVDNALDGENHDDDDNEPLGTANAPLEDEKTCRARLLHCVVCSNKDYGLHDMVRLSDSSADALAVFEAIELKALTFFALRSLGSAGGFSKEDLPNCITSLC